MENVVYHLVGTRDINLRWQDCYFPFTEPSLEIEIFINNEWVEVLGSGTTEGLTLGILHREVLNKTTKKSDEYIGWAAGFGVERLAMLLYKIPDIRMLWSQDERFLSQFRPGEVSKFKPFSKYPICYKDVSFWVGSG